MRHTILQRWKPDPENELSWFLIVYLLTLFGGLLLVHLLQQEREGSGSSSRSPIHQDLQKAR